VTEELLDVVLYQNLCALDLENVIPRDEDIKWSLKSIDMHETVDVNERLSDTLNFAVVDV
jgi:hypothetical protein